MFEDINLEINKDPPPTLFNKVTKHKKTLTFFSGVTLQQPELFF